MLSLGSAGGIEKRGLDEKDEGRSGVAGFPLGDLVEGATEVHGAGASACGGAPGDGAVQRPVHFACAGAVTIAAERGVKRRRETVASQIFPVSSPNEKTIRPGATERPISPVVRRTHRKY